MNKPETFLIVAGRHLGVGGWPEPAYRVPLELPELPELTLRWWLSRWRAELPNGWHACRDHEGHVLPEDAVRCTQRALYAARARKRPDERRLSPTVAREAL